MKFYCGRALEDAHDAVADVEVTIDVFQAQIQRCGLEPDTKKLTKEYKGQVNYLDQGFYIKENEEGQLTFDFGKH